MTVDSPFINANVQGLGVESSNYLAVIPAAGQSFRMGGQHKLLLPWNRDSTVIEEVLHVWTKSRATHIVIVVRAEDVVLQRACRDWPRTELVIPPRDPIDMKESIQFGLDYFAAKYSPIESDRWLVAPADMPTLKYHIIDQIIEASQGSGSIVIPRYREGRGHPISLPWYLAEEVSKLASGQGIDQLIAKQPVEYVDVSAEDCPKDIDTPDDYSWLREQISRQRHPS